MLPGSSSCRRGGWRTCSTTSCASRTPPGPSLPDAPSSAACTAGSSVSGRAHGGAPPRRVVCLEWLDPLFLAGHWIPDVVAAAGGHDLLGRPGDRSVEITDEDLVGADPQTVVLAPCGLDAAGAWREAERIGLAERLERHGLSPSVVAIDAGRLLSRPGPGLVEGAEALAGMLAGPRASRRGAPAGIAA